MNQVPNFMQPLDGIVKAAMMLLFGLMIDGAIAQVPQEPRIQIEDRQTFLSELAQLGGSISIADPDMFGRLFGWTPVLTGGSDSGPFRNRWLAHLVLQPATESNISSIFIDYTKGSLETERGYVHIHLRHEHYCLRTEDLTSAWGKPKRVVRSRTPHFQRFEVYVFAMNPGTDASAYFDNQEECLRRFRLHK